ncbi:hypothetical protein BDZ97DRAFT_1752291 [Flammula alnicola]|nr:hypothetical protein BDZ97DRAFT_1752291 [Flammula alnicola]
MSGLMAKVGPLTVPTPQGAPKVLLDTILCSSLAPIPPSWLLFFDNRPRRRRAPPRGPPRHTTTPQATSNPSIKRQQTADPPQGLAHRPRLRAGAEGRGHLRPQGGHRCQLVGRRLQSGPRESQFWDTEQWDNDDYSCRWEGHFEGGAAAVDADCCPPTPSPSGPPSAAGAAARLAAAAAAAAGSGYAPSSSLNVVSSVGPSPASSSHDLVTDVEEAERQTNRRSMYRSPGTSSSPDLATLLRKAKERGGAMVGAGVGVGTLRQQPASSHSYSSATLVASSSSFGERMSSRGEDSSPEWVVPSPQRAKGSGTIKAPKSSVRAKTSAFWGKMMGQSTVRERSLFAEQKTDASLYPSPNNNSHAPALMSAFTPPVPAIPPEHRSPIASPIADVFSTSTRAVDSKRQLPSRKPLPPIMSDSLSPAKKDSDDTDRSIVFVEKQSPLPPLPPPSPAPATPKRRSISNADARPLLSPSSPPILPQTPDSRRKEPENTFSGILDVFKGELSMLDPISLDLRDPSTPPRRQLPSQTQANGLVLSPRDTQDDRVENKKPPSSSVDPLLQSPGGRSETSNNDEAAAATKLSAIVPPRTSSLQSSARYSIGSATHATGSRHQLGNGPPRSMSGPSTSLAPQSQSPRDGSRLRVLHRSTASSSEPSLVPADSARVCEQPVDLSFVQFDDLLNRATGIVPTSLRRGSEQDLAFASPDSAQFTTSPTPIITGDDDVEDMESRGKDFASRCWNENEDFLAKEKIAEWLGGHGQVNKVALRYYIDFFDFAGLRLDLAFRRLCGKLYLKGETQQVDRILEQFSRRYWDCNPGGLYGSANIVHAVSYSLLLLNTDLHVAELTARMSRMQFVRNTMTAIQMQLQPNPSARLSTSDLTYDDCSSSIRGAGSDETEMMTRSKRSNSIASWNSLSREAILSLPVSPAITQSNQLGANLPNGSTPSVQISNGHDQSAPGRQVHGRAWEVDMENLLKEMYTAIKHQQILQPLNSSVTRASVSSLSPGGGGMMRNRSLRGQPDRLTTLKRGSIRGLQSILSVQSGASPYSSNSSIDGRVSPSPSFATSTNEAMYGSSSSFLNPSLGFASNLSHTIIREAQESDDRSVHSEGSTSTTISISDEELALLGAPWAKEGMLCRKQYWESAGKRAKDKGWLDVFVVIQKGELKMFTFGDHTSGMSGTFGGGNWLANANLVGTILLAHSLAHALPPPGYHRRPHCMVLTLANRGVYFFQAGTEELVNEWVSTCNYWAARTSKEPLAGGVSNMEYGWSRVADLYGHGRSQSQAEFQREPDLPDSVSVRSGKAREASMVGKMGVLLSVAHTLHERTRPSLKKDLEAHNELREPMAALVNVISSVSSSRIEAMSLRLKKRGEKALEHALSHSTPVDDPTPSSKKWKGPEELPISEEVEPTTPSARQQFQQNTHRRETAEVGDGLDDDDDN